MKGEILEAVGKEGALLTRLIPALEQIIGYQTPILDLISNIQSNPIPPLPK